MSDKITAQLETICQTLTSVDGRLQKLENIFERVSGLEKSVSTFGTELSKLTNKTKEIEKIASDVETAVEFANKKQNSDVKFSYSGPGELSDKVHQNHEMIETCSSFLRGKFLTAK